MTDITYDDKVLGGAFTHEDANEIKTAANSKLDATALDDTTNPTDEDADEKIWSVDKVNTVFQPHLGTVGTAGLYFIEEIISGVTGKGVAGNWKMFYTNAADGNVEQFDLGTSGHLLKSNGTGGAPSFIDPMKLGDRAFTTAVDNAFSAAGKVGYLHTDGTVILTDANAAATSSAMLLMSTDEIAADASGVFSKGGEVTVTGHGFTVGQPIFLSETAGAITNTAPGTGTFVRLIGYALDANTIDFRPDATWVEVA